MKRCKLSNCREPAVPHGKQYCEVHLAEYKRKQREYAERMRALPTCSTYGCDNKVPPRLIEQGIDCCSSCDEERSAAEQQHTEQQQLVDSINAIATLDEMKEWLISRVYEGKLE